MEEIVAGIDDLMFDIERDIEEQVGAMSLPFPGMDKSGAAVCAFNLRNACERGNACPFRHTEGDRTVVCKHWLRGLCKKGDKCEFLHEFDMTKMPECFFYSRFNACTNKECTFQHIDPGTKRKDCPWYDRGFCRHGPSCRHRHTLRVLCTNYLVGFCPLGPECKHVHPKFSLPQTQNTHQGSQFMSNHPPIQNHNQNPQSIQTIDRSYNDQHQHHHHHHNQHHHNRDNQHQHPHQQHQQQPQQQQHHHQHHAHIPNQQTPRHMHPYNQQQQYQHQHHNASPQMDNVGHPIQTLHRPAPVMQMMQPPPVPHQAQMQMQQGNAMQPPQMPQHQRPYRPMDLQHVVCFFCGERGHYANRCFKKQRRF
ncbi:Cleavage and polyadenylation specificity factor subunit 4, partial [Fragariocoptes setiger]